MTTGTMLISLVDVEALFAKARERQRRRRRIIVVVAVAVVVAGAAGCLVFWAVGGLRASAANPGQSSVARNGSLIQPERPGPLAVGPGGRLYIGDAYRHQILERLPNGTFQVVAGTGKAGFSGDGGPAVRAEIRDPGGMAVSNNGTLSQIAGSRPSAGLCVLDVERPARNQSVGEPDGLAFDRAGNLYLGGWACKVLRVITSGGIMRLPDGRNPFYPFIEGGLATAPDGSVIGMSRDSIERLSPAGVTMLYDFFRRHVPGVGGTFEPFGIAVAPDGTIFTDTVAGGDAYTTALIAISRDGHIQVLWKS